MFSFSHQWQMCHDFKYFEQHTEIFMKKVKIYDFGTDTDPDRLYPESGSTCPGRRSRSRSGKMMRIRPDLDPDPQHWSVGKVSHVWYRMILTKMQDLFLYLLSFLHCIKDRKTVLWHRIRIPWIRTALSWHIL
jgi:hypothetical protein